MFSFLGNLFGFLSDALKGVFLAKVYSAGAQAQAAKDTGNVVQVVKAEEAAVVNAPTSKAELLDTIDKGSF